MKRSKVISSNINSVGYDKNKNLLEVEFYNGGIFQYHPVTNEQYKDLMKADSIGEHFSKNIRNNKGIKYHKIS